MTDREHCTYLAEEQGPLPFCPGCGHDLIAKALNRALVKLQLDPRKVVIVTDIGCIGLTCKHFSTSAFHGLHGRSITYACGLKLARPELKVIAMMGDGGCGIGGTHLLNVARRNIGITLLVANNFNYGMTGGQHSVTTPEAGITSTTPWGNIEAPMDLCATAGAAGAAWVRRVTAFDKDLPDSIADAIQQPGFSMLDIWELCTAYYMPRNDLRKKGLFELLDRFGLTTGQQVDKPRPEYSERYRVAYSAGKSVLEKRPFILPAFDSELGEQTAVVIAGSAGGKIKSAATVFAQGGMLARLQATQKDDYPITVQAGPSVADVILSPERIDYTGSENPEVVVLLSGHGVARMRLTLAKLSESSVIYADESLELPPTRAQVLCFPFIATAKKVGRLSLPFVALGTLLESARLYPVAALEQAIRTFQKGRIAETSIAAVAAGRALSQLPGSATLSPE